MSPQSSNEPAAEVRINREGDLIIAKFRNLDSDRGSTVTLNLREAERIGAALIAAAREADETLPVLAS